jgi:Fasciclin domain
MKSFVEILNSKSNDDRDVLNEILGWNVYDVSHHLSTRIFYFHLLHHSVALCERLQQTGLLGALNQGNWTVFAPTNEAFVSLPRSYLDFLDSNVADLSNFLLLHAAPNRVLKKADLPCVAGQNLVEMATTKGTKKLENDWRNCGLYKQ